MLTTSATEISPMPKQLPNIESAQVDQSKVMDYLLNTEKMPSAAKARFFKSFGFQADSWEQMAAALVDQARRNSVVKEHESRFGTKYKIEGIIKTPDGRNPRIWTVWQIDKDHLAPRLITAYPSSL